MDMQENRVAQFHRLHAAGCFVMPTAKLKAEGYAQSYVYAMYRRFAQVMGDAVADGIIPRSPCSRKTAPKTGAQRPYVATTAQVWAIYDAFPEGLRPAVLLSAFAGLRLAEAAALRASDVDFMRGVVHPAIQYPAKPLKSETSRTAVPIPEQLALMLSAELARTGARRPGHERDHAAGDTVGDRAGDALTCGGVSRACPRASGSTTCATTSRRCSSRRGST